MKQLFCLFFFLLFFFLIPQQIHAAEFYVAEYGRDTNAGTAAAPFQTFAKANAVVQPGDTVIVKGGTYAEKLTVTKNGTATAPITFKAASNEVVILDTANTASPIIYLQGNYIVVDGFEVRNSNAICVSLTGDNLVARNLNVHHCSSHGIYTDGAFHVIENNSVSYSSLVYLTNPAGGWGSGIKVRVGGDNTTIKNNRVFNNWGEGIAVTRGTNAKVIENIAYDNFSVNLYIDNSYSVLVDRNFVYCTPDSEFKRNGSVSPGIGLGEEFYDGWGSQLANVTITNNIVQSCSRGVVSYGAQQAGGGLDTIRIINNTFWDMTTTAVSFNFDTAPTKNRSSLVANNIIYQKEGKMLWAGYPEGITFANNNWSHTPPAYGQSTGDVIGMQPFTISGYRPENFKLANNSPLINKGVTYAQVVTDFEGKLRNSPNSPQYDIGAYEYQGLMASPGPLASSSPTPVASPNPSASVNCNKPRDFNGDGVITVTDLQQLIMSMYQTNFAYDVNCSFRVDAIDFGLLIPLLL